MNSPTQALSAAREIDLSTLDQVVGGAGIVVHDFRKQEQSDKLTAGTDAR